MAREFPRRDGSQGVQQLDAGKEHAQHLLDDGEISKAEYNTIKSQAQAQREIQQVEEMALPRVA